jgi:CheY-like chemotaxis protein
VSTDRRQPFVLVADDDRDTRELYRACFDTNGYRTGEAGTGSQTIASAIELVPEVLLSDYVLPDIDGITIAQRLKADPRTASICIVMVTGYATPDLERRALDAGVERLLFKPCLPQIAMREVSRALARQASRKSQPAPAQPAVGSDTVDGRGSAAVTRVRHEFAALPGLSLTAEQARLVFDLEREQCDQILHMLVAEGFLSKTPLGAYKRPHSRTGH